MKPSITPLENLERYRECLLAKRSELRSGLKACRQALTASEEPVSYEDLPSVAQEALVPQLLNNLDFEELRLVEKALQRLDAGEFGVCADCGATISPARLKAIPWAERCCACELAVAGTVLAG